MLEKLDLILRLARDCNFTLKRIESLGESRHISSVPSDDVREPEVIEKAEPEPEPKIVDETDPEPEAKSLIATPVYLLADPIMELLPFFPAMRVLLSLRPPDMYDPLRIFLNEAGLQEFGILVCGLVFSRADLSFAAFISLELPSTVASLSRKSISPPLPWLRHDASVLTPRAPPWPD